MIERRVGRRHFLEAAGGLTLAAVGLPLTAGCGNDGAGLSPSEAPPSSQPESRATATTGSQSSPRGPRASTAPSGGATTLLPTYVAGDVVKPDMPGTEKVPAAYLAYPSKPVKVSTAPPANGGTISMIMRSAGSGIPPAASSNPFLQELNKRIGAEMRISHIPASGYWQTLATTVAGGDIPDLVQFNRASATPAHLGDLLHAKFADLTDRLSGDNIKKYPNLSAIPTLAWRSAVFNGAIYGIPYPLARIGATLKVRQDIADTLGVDTSPKNGDEFLALCDAFTDERAGRWAFGVISPDLVNLVAAMTGSPNTWRVQDGKFVSYYSTDEFRKAIDLVSSMWKSGYIHPDAPSSGAAQRTPWFIAGTTPLVYNDAGSVPSMTAQGVTATARFSLNVIPTPLWDGGGQAPNWEIKGSYTLTSMRRAKDTRIDELLRVADWCAAPFGTEEYLFCAYGIQGRDYTLSGPDPIETKTGALECQGVGIHYLASPDAPTYVPGKPEVAKLIYNSDTQTMRSSLPLPTVGLTSETEMAKGASLSKAITGAYMDVIQGRKSLSDWDAAVKAWRSGGGDVIAREYEESYAKSGLA